ncbi:MAG TPA: hypothetical protein DCS93_09970 [Microscillaceae bacterium]|nr:hypothetical protein [Microscillaceae bacterium]
MNKLNCFKEINYRLWIMTGIIYLSMTHSVVQINAQPKLSNIEVFDIVKSLPTSQETYLLLKQQKRTFNQKLSRHIKKIKPQQVTSSDLVAMNLGVMSSKVLYAEMYGKREDARNALAKMKILMDSLRVETISSFKSLYEYINKSKDLDYLVFRTGAFIEQIKDYCFKRGRTKQLVLICSGDWTESMYLMLSETINKPQVNLKHRVLEQDIIIEQLVYMYQDFVESEVMVLVKKEMDNISTLIKAAKFVKDDGELEYAKLSKRKLRKILRSIKRIRFKIMHIR